MPLVNLLSCDRSWRPAKSWDITLRLPSYAHCSSVKQHEEIVKGKFEMWRFGSSKLHRRLLFASLYMTTSGDHHAPSNLWAFYLLVKWAPSQKCLTQSANSYLYKRNLSTVKRDYDGTDFRYHGYDKLQSHQRLKFSQLVQRKIR